LTWFNFDAPLIAAFMDRWRPETHTFHLPIGEMTLSLEDAAMFEGLSCAGEVMGPIDIPATWQADFLARFANVPQNDRAPAPYLPFIDTHGPTWTWIQQFNVRDSSY
jgi:beta-galactosidase/beta-glucuronidase